MVESTMNKVKILFLAANPHESSPIDIGEEIRTITEKIRLSDKRDDLDFIPVWAVRPDDLLQKLNEHKPHIVHFSGHGNRSGELILQDNNGASKPINAVVLKSLFMALKDNIQVVVLNACYSQTQSEAIATVVDCVIGMNTEIEDEAAAIFSSSFYRAIAFGRSIQDAFEQGKVALLLEGIAEAQTPQLSCRSSIVVSEIILCKDQSSKTNSTPPPKARSRSPHKRTNRQTVEEKVIESLITFYHRWFPYMMLLIALQVVFVPLIFIVTDLWSLLIMPSIVLIGIFSYLYTKTAHKLTMADFYDKKHPPPQRTKLIHHLRQKDWGHWLRNWYTSLLLACCVEVERRRLRKL